ncbi:TPA: DUF2534 family protein, partial [Escherichia coli]|nr:DUF2534 family protein [Escherichia coli]
RGCHLSHKIECIYRAAHHRATIGGVIEQYNIPLSEWTTSMYVIQSSMIFVYSLVFTVLLAIPLGIYFLGGEEQ